MYVANNVLPKCSPIVPLTVHSNLAGRSFFFRNLITYLLCLSSVADPQSVVLELPGIQSKYSVSTSLSLILKVVSYIQGFLKISTEKNCVFKRTNLAVFF